MFNDIQDVPYSEEQTEELEEEYIMEEIIPYQTGSSILSKISLYVP